MNYFVGPYPNGLDKDEFMRWYKPFHNLTKQADAQQHSADDIINWLSKGTVSSYSAYTNLRIIKDNIKSISRSLRQLSAPKLSEEHNGLISRGMEDLEDMLLLRELTIEKALEALDSPKPSIIDQAVQYKRQANASQIRAMTNFLLLRRRSGLLK